MDFKGGSWWKTVDPARGKRSCCRHRAGEGRDGGGELLVGVEHSRVDEKEGK